MHALAEAFAVLTGRRHGRRLNPSTAVQLLEASVLPFVPVVALTAKDVTAALADCQSRGVRGGAVYDLLHLVAARKAGADTLLTLDMRDFQALTRRGDPRIEAP